MTNTNASQRTAPSVAAAEQPSIEGLTRYDHRGCLMVPDTTGDYFLVPDVRAHLARQSQAAKAQAEPIYQVKSLIHSEFWHDTDWHSYEWNKENKQEVRIVNAAPTAQEVTQQAAMAEPVAWMRKSRKECTTAESKTWMESAGFGHWPSIAKEYTIPLYLAPTTSTVSAPEEVRNQALEEAAKVALKEQDEFREQAAKNNGRESDFAFGSVNSAERIANAIRALRTTSGKGEPTPTAAQAATDKD